MPWLRGICQGLYWFIQYGERLLSWQSAKVILGYRVAFLSRASRIVTLSPLVNMHYPASYWCLGAVPAHCKWSYQQTWLFWFEQVFWVCSWQGSRAGRAWDLVMISSVTGEFSGRSSRFSFLQDSLALVQQVLIPLLRKILRPLLRASGFAPCLPEQ